MPIVAAAGARRVPHNSEMKQPRPGIGRRKGQGRGDHEQCLPFGHQHHERQARHREHRCDHSKRLPGVTVGTSANSETDGESSDAAEDQHPCRPCLIETGVDAGDHNKHAQSVAYGRPESDAEREQKQVAPPNVGTVGPVPRHRVFGRLGGPRHEQRRADADQRAADERPVPSDGHATVGTASPARRAAKGTADFCKPSAKPSRDGGSPRAMTTLPAPGLRQRHRQPGDNHQNEKDDEGPRGCAEGELCQRAHEDGAA